MDASGRSWRGRRIAPAALAAVALLASTARAAEETMRLAIGQQRTVDAAGLTRASIADPDVCDIARAGDVFILTARRAGRTDLLLWSEAGTLRTIEIVVVDSAPRGLADEIRAVLADVPGLTVKAVGDRILLDGRLLARRDLDRVKAVADAYPQVLNLTTLDLSAHDALVASEIQKKIGFPLVMPEVLRDRVILKGTVFREEDKEAAAQIAGAYLPTVVNLLRVDPPLVELDVKFVALRRGAQNTHGFNVLKRLGVAAGAAAGVGGSPAVAVSAEAVLRVQELVGSGDAAIAAEPFLTTLSGKEATFHAGGEHGYRVSGTGVADVKFKKFGLLLTVRPEVLSTGEVKTHVSLEVSAPSADAAGGDMAFTTFKAESALSGRIDETIIMAGLAERIRDRFRERTPLLGRIPVLAEVFSERTDRREEKELVVLVTPRVPSVARAADEAAGRRIRPDARAPGGR